MRETPRELETIDRKINRSNTEIYACLIVSLAWACPCVSTDFFILFIYSINKMVSRSAPPNFRRRRYVKKANKKLATVGAVKKMINNRIDKTIVCATTAGGASTTAGTMYQLSTLTVDSKFFDFHTRVNLLNSTGPAVMRLIIFQWNETSNPVNTDVLTSAVYNDQYDNVTDYSRFVHILADRTYDMTLYDNQIKTAIFNFSGKKLRKVGINNVGYTNNIWCLAISSGTSVTVGTFYNRYIYSPL